MDSLTEPSQNGGAAEAPPVSVDNPADQGWRKDAKNRWFIPARGRSGVVYRQGTETVDEAHARDARGPKDRPPKAKPKASKPPAPTAPSLKELEFMLAEALKMPSAIMGMTGDEWPATHVVTQAPVLARNLTKAAEHNPWLRAKLEAMVSGEDMFVKLITALGVAGALVMYAAPPVIYYLNPKGGVLAGAAQVFEVPDRSKIHAERRAELEREMMQDRLREEAHAARASAAAQAAEAQAAGTAAAA